MAQPAGRGNSQGIFTSPALALARRLRLRPEGTAGPLTRSLESMENYYAGFGETWERFALMKARRICGSHELAYEFLRQHQPLFFRRARRRNCSPKLPRSSAASSAKFRPTISTSNSAPAVSARSSSSSKHFSSCTALNIPFFKKRPRSKHSARSHSSNSCPRRSRALLDRAYRLLRRIEHRLQIEAEQQTHSIPDDAIKARTARAQSRLSISGRVTHRITKDNDRVREIFNRLVASATSAPALDLTIFSDKSSATRSLNELARGSTSFHVAPRTRQIFGRLRPLLLEQLSGCADPDATLTAVVRFVEAFGLRSLLFEMLASNPKLLELLVRDIRRQRVCHTRAHSPSAIARRNHP